MRFAVVSSTPYSPSNRGIDIITEALSMCVESVDFIRFPVMPWQEKEASRESSIEIKGINSQSLVSLYGGYVERFMWWVPESSFRHLKSITCITRPQADFSKYDCVVLESGKPLFLLDRIPPSIPVIYRQSDPVELVLSRNRAFIELEHRTMERSHLILVVRQKIIDFYESTYPEYSKRMVLSVNGFSVPNQYESQNPYGKKTTNAVYLGYSRIDFETMKHICKLFPFIDYHVIGKCLRKKDLKRLNKFSNFKFHGNMTPSQYLPYVEHADLGVIPFDRKWTATKWIGLNSKYLLFMYFGLPIVSYRVGAEDEFRGLQVSFADDKDQFAECVQKTIDSGCERKRYNVNWRGMSKSGRIAEVISILQEHNLIR